MKDMETTMQPCRCALTVLAATLAAATSNGASAQTSRSNSGADACFEIIVPRAHMRLNGPLLFDRCSGTTWLLVRAQGLGGNARATYRWVRLEMDDWRPARSQEGAHRVPKSAGMPGAARESCFEFAGRRFCE
jgi:hypothetical protein